MLGDSGDTVVIKTTPALPSQSSWPIVGVGEEDGSPVNQVLMTQNG